MRARVREHVNPLSHVYQTSTALPDWQAIYAIPTQALHLDIGCARGRFLLAMAELKPDWNFLGLEIREPLVDEANYYRDRQGLRNLHYLFSNANYSLHSILSSLPPNVLQLVSIQFPDPWFKRRHQKRRVVQPELVHDLATFLAPGGSVFLQSDVLAVATEMRDRILAHPAFHVQSKGWLADNPLPTSTERERSTQKKGESVYRLLIHKR
jgi:tRNA (guanine-N7-)-methyltransferase